MCLRVSKDLIFRPWASKKRIWSFSTLVTQIHFCIKIPQNSFADWLVWPQNQLWPHLRPLPIVNPHLRTLGHSYVNIVQEKRKAGKKFFLFGRLAMASNIHMELSKLPKLKREEVHKLGVTPTILSHAISAIQSCDIVGFRLSSLDVELRTFILSAFVHSSRKGKVFYLTGGELSITEDGTVQTSLFFCPCKAGRGCFHKAVLYLLAVFFQTDCAPGRERPAWMGVSRVVSSKTMLPHIAAMPCFAAARTRDALQFGNLLCQTPIERQILRSIFCFIERSSRKPQETSSWNIALQWQLNSFDSGQSLSELQTARSPAGSTRMCKRCRGPLKGHKRGQPCPSTQPQLQSIEPSPIIPSQQPSSSSSTPAPPTPKPRARSSSSAFTTTFTTTR